MAKVDWITWKTDPSEIINPKLVNDKIDELFYSYDNHMKPSVYDEIKRDIVDGGLSEDAYIVSNSTPININATKILDKINEIESTIEKLKSNISKVVIEQKDIEKNQLIKAINDKIKIEEELRKRIENNVGVQDKISEIGNDPNDIIGIINDRIDRLNKKLIVVENL